MKRDELIPIALVLIVLLFLFQQTIIPAIEKSFSDTGRKVTEAAQVAKI